MRGHTNRGVIAENLTAALPNVFLQQQMSRKKKMCWSCQKDKSTKDGQLDLRSGLHKFVCADCIAAKKAKHEVPPVQSTD